MDYVIPMIPLGLKETKEVSFMEPFSDFILEHYSEDSSVYEDAIADITDTRQVSAIFYHTSDHDPTSIHIRRPPKPQPETSRAWPYCSATTTCCTTSRDDFFRPIEVWGSTSSGTTR